MKSIIKTNQPEVGHGIGIFDPTMHMDHSDCNPVQIIL